jgi:uncharacterized protein (DUF1810 family)
MAGDPYDLERFVAAQDSHGTYDGAVTELRNGRKVTHWMWFVFPQIAGLGRSRTSVTYAITSLDEARAYLRHPVLGRRLMECVGILEATTDSSAEQIFGGIDAAKLHSSLTLFMRADPAEPLFERSLQRYFAGLPDAATDQRL